MNLLFRVCIWIRTETSVFLDVLWLPSLGGPRSGSIQRCRPAAVHYSDQMSPRRPTSLSALLIRMIIFTTHSGHHSGPEAALVRRICSYAVKWRWRVLIIQKKGDLPSWTSQLGEELPILLLFMWTVAGMCVHIILWGSWTDDEQIHTEN